ncbi:MAG TPA: PIG-L family deacetylase [Solirubrobacteraceae bacterium]|nr:PIG-L family deacetylase [Solirubrobacteraceae bacterium]
MTATVILSPHPDDAVLSCWHALSAKGEVTVINVFAAIPSPGQPLSWWDRMTGAVDSAARMRERLAEDEQALVRAGRTAVNLEFLDDQYRNGAQPLDEIVAELDRRLPPSTRVLAPAGIGAHPDHLLVRSAAIRLRDGGNEVALYADLPHAIRHGWPPHVSGGSRRRPGGAAQLDWEQALARIGRALEPTTIHRLTARARADKLAALREYSSQLEALSTMAYQPLETPDTLRYEVVWGLGAGACR